MELDPNEEKILFESLPLDLTFRNYRRIEGRSIDWSVQNFKTECWRKTRVTRKFFLHGIYTHRQRHSGRFLFQQTDQLEAGNLLAKYWAGSIRIDLIRVGLQMWESKVWDRLGFWAPRKKPKTTNISPDRSGWTTIESKVWVDSMC